MIYTFTSVKEVISKVYRDLNISDMDRWQDMIEWIAEALDGIHAPEQLKTKVERLHVNDFKVKIPCDLRQINMIYYNGYPLLPNSSAMGNSLININTTHDTIDPITLEKLNGNPALLDIKFVPYETQMHYDLDPCYIRTTFKSGDIYLSYEAIPLDEDGFPMMPDEYSYKTACFWYCAKMLMLPDWFAGKHNRYEEAELKWQFYCGQAGAKSMMPDLSRLENIKNQWVRLVPDINRGCQFFNGLSQQERVNI